MSEITVINKPPEAESANSTDVLVRWAQKIMTSEHRRVTRKEERQILDALLQKIAQREYRVHEEIPASRFFSHCYLISVIMEGVQIDMKISDWQIDMLMRGKKGSEFAQIASAMPSGLAVIAPIKKRIERLWQMIDHHHHRNQEDLKEMILK